MQVCIYSVQRRAVYEVVSDRGTPPLRHDNLVESHDHLVPFRAVVPPIQSCAATPTSQISHTRTLGLPFRS